MGRRTKVGVLGKCPGAFPRVLVSSSLQAENQGVDMLLGRAGRPPHPSLTQQVPPWQEEVSSRRAGEAGEVRLGDRAWPAEGSPSFPQYKGQVNLHVFEDWCGGAVGHLRKNLHFPLFPHVSAWGGPGVGRARGDREGWGEAGRVEVSRGRGEAERVGVGR